MGKVGTNFLKEQGYFVLDTNMQLPVVPETLLVSSVEMVSQDFQYDPFSVSSIEFDPLFSFNGDTLIVNDYWAVSDQPTFKCSTSFFNDTLHISYVPSGVVNDWSPEVKTTLKFVIDIKDYYSYPDIIVHFHKVSNARSSSIIQCRNASHDYFERVPLVNYSYRYRAHSDSTLLVILSYQYFKGKFKGSPEVTMHYKSDIAYLKDTLLSRFKDELTWLNKEGVCAISDKTISEIITTGTVEKGELYWTRQKNALNSLAWYYTNNEYAYLPIDGCGSIDFRIPQNSLITSASPVKTATTKTDNENVRVKLSPKEIILESNTPFDSYKIFNALGKQIFHAQNQSRSTFIRKNITLRPGMYFIEIMNGKNNIVRNVSCY